MSPVQPQYWWFEVLIILHKCFMTGALCVIGENSTKPLIAVLFQLAFLLIVLKTAPYEEDDDDLSSFISSLAIVLTCLCGFALSASRANCKSRWNLPVCFSFGRLQQCVQWLMFPSGLHQIASVASWRFSQDSSENERTVTRLILCEMTPL